VAPGGVDAAAKTGRGALAGLVCAHPIQAVAAAIAASVMAFQRSFLISTSRLLREI
jgi:hypothetical protein